VLLLLVLAILALFALIGLAFVLIAGQSQRSALTVSRMDRAESVVVPSPKLFNRAIRELLRGPSSAASMVGAGGILEDMYGNNPLSGSLTGLGQYAANGAFQQLYNLPTTCNASDLARRIGCVLTITYVPPTSLGGPTTAAQKALVGQSTRIVGASANSSIVQVLCFADGATLPPSGTQFIINGVPFSGTGFGYNPADGQLDLTYDPIKRQLNSGSFLAALLPNIPLSAYSSAFGGPPNPPGGSNSDYTAADYQHMFLAAQTPANPSAPDGRLNTPLPSFCRPELVNYWINQEMGSGSNFAALWNNNNNKYSDLCRAITLRPIGAEVGPTGDHPNFTGSNVDVTGAPAFNPAWDGVTPGGGQWDVDNDGDGIPDSNWMDLGAPVRATSDGRLYKPLYAVLCVDLDGRLNLNAHGCMAQAFGATSGTASATNAPVGNGSFRFANGAPGGTSTLSLPCGMGYGPGEINLLPLLQQSSLSPTQQQELYQNLLSGSSSLAGRYGETPSATEPPAPGVTGQEGPLFFNKHFELHGLLNPSQPYSGFDYSQSSSVPPGTPLTFGSPPDPQGMMTVGLDLRGQPLYTIPQLSPATFWSGWPGAAVNTPYELNLGPGQAYGPLGATVTDNPFSVSELERLLRPFDKDASSLAGRLATLTSLTSIAPSTPPAQATSVLVAKRDEITTVSEDVPAAPSALSAEVLWGDLSPTLDSALIANLKTTLQQYQTGSNPSLHVIDFLSMLLVKKNNRHGGSMTMAQAEAFVTGSGPIGRTAPGASGAPGTPIYAPFFPIELLSGRKMDLNRPFSSGVFNSSQEIVPAVDAKGNLISSVPFDYLNNGSPNGFNTSDPTDNARRGTVAARQAYARQLYLLAMLLMDDNYTVPLSQLPGPTGGTEALNTQERTFLTARRIAQWAINVACFRTNDSIMVPFEFDAQPFTVENPGNLNNSNSAGNPCPWDVDGDLTTDEYANSLSGGGAIVWRGVVWGCKRPELLLTETLAFHDRRVADTNWDDNNQKKRTDPTNPPTNKTPLDWTLDQTRIPQGSFFCELYATAGDANAAAPTDLYTASGGRWALNLGAVAPVGTAAACPSSLLPSGAPSPLYQYLVGVQYPVWRLVISSSRMSAPHSSTLANPGNDVVWRASGVLAAGATSPTTSGLRPHPDTASFEPEQYRTGPAWPTGSLPNPNAAGRFSLLPDNNDRNVTIDRIVWFTPNAPLTAVPSVASPSGPCHLDYDKIYYNRSGNVLLPGGQYCVIGPRKTTFVGSLNQAAASNTTKSYGFPSAQAIVINPSLNPLPAAPFNPQNPSPVNWTPTGGPGSTAVAYPNGSQIKPAYAMIAAGGVPSGVSANPPSWPTSAANPPSHPAAAPWANNSPAAQVVGYSGQYGFGISISEPLFSSTRFYTEPKYPNPAPLATGVIDAYGDLTMTTPGEYFENLPEERVNTITGPPASGPTHGKPLVDESNSTATPPVNLLNTGTTANYKTVFLQRLANPSAPYDPVTNPYRTVDWLPVDLTVFNGEDAPNPALFGNVSPPLNYGGADPWDPDDPNTNYSIAIPGLSFQSRERGDPNPAVAGTPNNQHNIWTEVIPWQSGAGGPALWPLTASQPTDTAHTTGIVFDFDLIHSLGYINKTYQNALRTPANPNAQAWISGGGGALGVPTEYYGDPLGPFPWLNFNYRPFVSPAELLLVPSSSPDRLLFEYNFTAAATSPYNLAQQPGFGGLAATGVVPPGGQPYPHLLNLFETVDNPPPPATPTVWAPKLYRLFDFVGVPSPFVATELIANPTYAMQEPNPPPGSHVFHPPFNRIPAYREPGKMNLNTFYSQDEWNGLMNNFPATAGSSWQSFWQARQGYGGHSVFAMASGYPTRFARPFRSSSGGALAPVLSSSPTMLPPYAPANQIASTLLGDVFGETALTNPLLAYPPSATVPATDANRNPYFRYQLLQRLENMVTTRSNVFAVWITVGYFQVSPAPSSGKTHSDGSNFSAADYQFVYPDGYQLGQELGSDTGEQVRHRAFFIIDRSIPVGFQRGQDNNVEKAIVLSRYIE
jgi:hypothetical protein